MFPTVAILGIGAMGEALARGLLRAGWPSEAIVGVARRDERCREVKDALGIPCILDVAAAAAAAEVVVVAVKPRDVKGILGGIRPVVGSSQVVVSLAAGITASTLEAGLPGIPVVRAMPNTPSLVGEGVAGVAAGSGADQAHVELAARVLAAVGRVEVVDESLLDAVTAISGSGPAYVFLLAEALTEAAIREGLSREVAERLVHHTVRGAGHLLTETDAGPTELRSQVTSPGGTTAAALHVLEERGFRAIVEDAVAAAADRSRELGTLDP